VTQHDLIMGSNNDATAGSLQPEYDCALAARRRGIPPDGRDVWEATAYLWHSH
jgi:hypothetical protein